MFRSHLISMIILSLVISVMLSLVKYDTKREILRYGMKLFIYMTLGTILFSWVMHLL